MSELYSYIGLQLQGVALQTFEQLFSTSTNLELHLANNPHLLVTLKAGSEGGQLKK